MKIELAIPSEHSVHQHGLMGSASGGTAKGEASMDEVERRLFMGIKVSPKLQTELDHCVPGTECYFKEDKPEYLQF